VVVEGFLVDLPIVTERLVLRRYTYDDIEDILEFVSDASVARATPEIEATESGVRRYIDMQNFYRPFEQGKCFDLAVQRIEDGKVIGLLSLVCKEHKLGEVGYALGVDHRGQGYATEGARALMAYGFTSLGLHRIQATTSSDNTESWRVMDRLGMTREAQLRDAAFRDGRWFDVLIYGILAAEWQSVGTDGLT
jgi:RimJ/RimL family protein N-acetyltransferase